MEYDKFVSLMRANKITQKDFEKMSGRKRTGIFVYYKDKGHIPKHYADILIEELKERQARGEEVWGLS